VLFPRYIKDLLHGIFILGIGCNVGGIYYNILACADDLVLLAAMWSALQLLLDRLLKHCNDIDVISRKHAWFLHLNDVINLCLVLFLHLKLVISHCNMYVRVHVSDNITDVDQ